MARAQNRSKHIDYKKYWKDRHAQVGSLKASGLQSVSVKANHLIYKMLADQYLDLLHKRVDMKNVRSILDCGYGDGYFLKFFQGHFPDKKLQGVDISQGARDKIDFIDKEHLVVNDLASFKMGKKFDIAHCFDVLYHVLDEADYRASLENIARHSDRYVILHERFFDRVPGFSSAHVRFRRAEVTNQVLNSHGFFLHADTPTHFFAARFWTLQLNKFIPGLLYRLDKTIAKKLPDHLQEVLGSHSIRVYKKAESAA